MHDQTFLNEYFQTVWSPRTDSSMYSSYQNIAKKIPKEYWVLDVGCGGNPLHNLLPHVIGIDPANNNADFHVTIEDFIPPHLFDVACCLGSINFGDHSVIKRQIEKVVSCLKPTAQVFWRLNPGRNDHDSQLCKNIDFYPWTHAKLELFARQYGFQQTNDQVEMNGSRLRLYAEWSR